MGQESLHQRSQRGRRSAAGTENLQTAAQREVGTMPNSSIGSDVGRATETVGKTRGVRQAAVAAAAAISASSSSSSSPSSSSSSASNTNPGSSEGSGCSGSSVAPPSSRQSKKRRHAGDVAPRGNAHRHRSVATVATRNDGATRYVPDDESSQPSTSSAPPQKIRRHAFLNFVNADAPPKPIEIKATGTKRSKFACCTGPLNTKFSSFVRFCETGCTIKIGDAYWINKQGTVYCSACYEAKEEAKNFNKCKNVNRDEEKTLTCKKCHRKWHECCSLDLQHKNFTCSSCTKKRTIRTTLTGYSNNRFESFMEENLNGMLKERLTPEQMHQPLSVASYKEKKETALKEFVPRPLRSAFVEKYGETIKYDVRTIYLFQRVDGVDVLVFVMVCHKYKNILGKSWTVIDYLDSVPFVEPKEARGTVFRGVILLYLEWAKKIGFNHAHLFSNPPDQGTDYILSIHPIDQLYKTADELLKWYNALLRKGVERGVLVEVRTFKQEMERKPYTQPTDLLPFEGGLWMNCMSEFDRDIRKEFGKTLPKDQYFEKFSELMKEKFKANAKNNFFIDLDLKSKRVTDPDPRKPHKTLGDRDAFLEKCRKHNWEFSSLRRAKYTSVAVITMMMGELGGK
ncbi:hypothetical protein CAEBREN_31096 [Caenorhabditis brenneri]|uniref:histone acetyltransferase n=1 Tax=Caenorhabditis brenneri TaxID=135651 RepID=G0MDL6_CAEBE|nr:hypothetical protein CAEBREN_31096 [Caenorhabditis brenneri]